MVRTLCGALSWVPAFAGMTDEGAGQVAVPHGSIARRRRDRPPPGWTWRGDPSLATPTVVMATEDGRGSGIWPLLRHGRPGSGSGLNCGGHPSGSRVSVWVRLREVAAAQAHLAAPHSLRLAWVAAFAAMTAGEWARSGWRGTAPARSKRVPLVPLAGRGVGWVRPVQAVTQHRATCRWVTRSALTQPTTLQRLDGWTLGVLTVSRLRKL